MNFQAREMLPARGRNPALSRSDAMTFVRPILIVSGLLIDSIHSLIASRMPSLLVVCCLFIGVASPARAVILTGSFTGVATNADSFLGVPDGTPMTGTFQLDLGYPFALADTDGSTYAHYEAANFDVPPDPIHFNFSVPSLGLVFDFDSTGFLNLYLRQTADGQSINFSTYYPKGSGAEITLAGATGALFDSLELGAVHAGPLSVSDSFAHFNQVASISNDIRFDSVDVTAAVPEPGSGLLVCVGLAALWAGTRLQRKQANCKHG
jgi:hypothetical protein